MYKKKIEISIIIPVFNEEKSVTPLYQKLTATLKDIKVAHEIIFIDDGSTDQTITRLINLKKTNKKVIIVQLQGNSGKAAALQTGFDQSKGKYLITLDGDLQDDPQEIPRFLKKLDQGCDLVCGWKWKRKDPLEKIIFSKVANFIAGKTTGVTVHDMNCGFKAYKRKVVNNLALYGEIYRYIPILAAKKGFKVEEIKIRHHPRRYGRSKYGTRRLLSGFFDFVTVFFLTKFITRPLHFFGLLGSVFAIIGFALSFYLTIIWFQGEAIGRRPILFLAILLIVLGGQFFSIGLIGEMITNREARKNYIIKRKFS